MGDEADLGFGFATAPPSLVTLTPFSPSARRLSSCFDDRSRRPVLAARKLAWVSLQGRLVNADEASSARAVGLAPPQAAAWELFSPVHRFLIVAVIGVAVAESKKNAQICRLKKSVQLRDQVLSSMQQKLDSLCEQLNNVKDCSESLQAHEIFGSRKTKFVDCGCCICDRHQDQFSKLEGNSATKATGEDAILPYKTCLTNSVEQEERRMSDLSDWASSVTSVAEIQMNNLAIEQDIYNLKRDCEDKDSIIKELTTLLQSTDLAGSKRMTELEDIIKRKNTTITRLKKDVVILEQKVMNFARLVRPSFSSPKPTPSVHIPQMTDNLIYDMDSTTSPSSSSDSDNSHKDPSQPPKTPDIPPQAFDFNPIRNQKSMPPMLSSEKRKLKRSKSRSTSPLKEISINRKSEAVCSSSSRQRHLSASTDSKASGRRIHISTQKDSASHHKRWV